MEALRGWDSLIMAAFTSDDGFKADLLALLSMTLMLTYSFNEDKCSAIAHVLGRREI